ncbi:hypothetical protein L218DRAFT_960641 [Marasmius fiardii PR-910]|nr:hypothetical protein L218DRAFT_960641 [Marasmius fiardii PR-910]
MDPIHAIGGSKEVFYIPSFITEDEEEYLVRKIVESPRQKWKNLANRRLQLLGGQLTAKNILIPEPFPSFIDKYPDIVARLKNTGAFQGAPHGAPNHIILNEYLPGQGIMPHEDGPAYHPVVATISLGSHTMFHYYRYKSGEEGAIEGAIEGADLGPKAQKDPITITGRSVDPVPVLSVLLEPRSVVITTAKFYTSHLHGISEVSEDLIISGKEDERPRVVLLGGRSVGIDNWEAVVGDRYKAVLQTGGTLKREPRHSLTCRDVVRISRATGALYASTSR